MPRTFTGRPSIPFDQTQQHPACRIGEPPGSKGALPATATGFWRAMGRLALVRSPPLNRHDSLCFWASGPHYRNAATPAPAPWAPTGRRDASRGGRWRPPRTIPLRLRLWPAGPAPLRTPGLGRGCARGEAPRAASQKRAFATGEPPLVKRRCGADVHVPLACQANRALPPKLFAFFLWPCGPPPAHMRGRTPGPSPS